MFNLVKNKNKNNEELINNNIKFNNIRRELILNCKIFMRKYNSNTILTTKLKVLIKRCLNVMSNQKDELFSYSNDLIISAVWFLIFKELYNLKLKFFLKFKKNITLSDFNTVLNILYFNLLKDKVINLIC